MTTRSVIVHFGVRIILIVSNVTRYMLVVRTISCNRSKSICGCYHSSFLSCHSERCFMIRGTFLQGGVFLQKYGISNLLLYFHLPFRRLLLPDFWKFGLHYSSTKQCCRRIASATMLCGTVVSEETKHFLFQTFTLNTSSTDRRFDGSHETFDFSISSRP